MSGPRGLLQRDPPRRKSKRRRSQSRTGGHASRAALPRTPEAKAMKREAQKNIKHLQKEQPTQPPVPFHPQGSSTVNHLDNLLKTPCYNYNNNNNNVGRTVSHEADDAEVSGLIAGVNDVTINSNQNSKIPVCRASPRPFRQRRKSPVSVRARLDDCWSPASNPSHTSAFRPYVDEAATSQSPVQSQLRTFGPSTVVGSVRASHSHSMLRAQPDDTAASQSTEPGEECWIDASELQITQLRLGRGGYGTVFRARRTREHFPRMKDCPVAVKVVQCKQQNAPRDSTGMRKIAREARLQMNLRHDNIVEFLGLSIDKRPHAVTNVPVDCWLIVLELCKESLATAIQREEMPWSLRWSYAMDIADGMKYLHERGLAHLDLKPVRQTALAAAVATTIVSV